MDGTMVGCLALKNPFGMDVGIGSIPSLSRWRGTGEFRTKSGVVKSSGWIFDRKGRRELVRIDAGFLQKATKTTNLLQLRPDVLFSQ